MSLLAAAAAGGGGRRADGVRLFKRTFRFTGGEITGELLTSTGYRPGAHAEDCPVFEKVAARNLP